jgi:hypothetical protein
LWLEATGVVSRGVFGLCCLLLVAGMATATPLDDYQDRVASVHDRLSDIGPHWDGERFNAELDDIARLLPATEQIEYGDRTIDVNNAWFHVEIDYLKERTNPDERQTRIDSILAHLGEIEAAAATILDGREPHGSAAERKHLHEILGRPEFQKPDEPMLARLIRQVKEYLADVLANLGGITGGDSTGSVIRALLVPVFIVIIAVLIRIAWRRWREKPATPKRQRLHVLGEEIEEGISAADLIGMARALAASGDYRTAIRRLFVALLYELGDRGLLELRDDYTNREYLRGLRTSGTAKAAFVGMTGTFEAVWYGQSAADQAVYERFEAEFQTVLAGVGANPGKG